MQIRLINSAFPFIRCKTAHLLDVVFETKTVFYRWGEAIEDFKYKKRQYLYLSDRVGGSEDTINSINVLRNVQTHGSLSNTVT